MHWLIEMLTTLARNVSGWGLALATIAIVLGPLSMIVVDTIKDLTPIRTGFHRILVRHWLNQHARRLWLNQSAQRAEAHVPGPEIRGDSLDALHDLERLTTGNKPNALYTLPVEQLAAQVMNALQAALDFPARHMDLLSVVGAAANPKDFVTLFEYRPERPATPPTAVPPTAGATTASALSPEQTARLEEFRDARNRVANHLQRSVDELQVTIGVLWKRQMRTACGLLSVLLALAIRIPDTPPGWALVAYLLIFVVSGYIGSVSRDLVSVLQKLRK